MKIQPGSSSSYDDIVGYIQAGLSVKAIADRVGMNELATRRLVNELVRTHELKYKPLNDDDTPYGMDRESLKHRMFLGDKLYDLREKLGADRARMSRLIGLNRNEQLRAEQRPFDHNWTISQIQRLAQAYGVNYTEFLHG